MELDDLKQGLARLDRRLEEQLALDLARARRDGRDRLHDALRPMARAQARLIFAGAITILLGVATWRGAMGHAAGPFVSGVIFHIYGVAMILFGAVTRTLIAGIDWAAPVLDLQRRLAAVRRAHVVAGIAIGLSWCVLWVPAMILGFFLLFGVDLYAPSPATWHWLAIGGVVMIAVAWLVRRRARAGGNAGLAAAIDGLFTGEHLRRAQAELDSIRQFERD